VKSNHVLPHGKGALCARPAAVEGRGLGLEYPEAYAQEAELARSGTLSEATTGGSASGIAPFAVQGRWANSLAASDRAPSRPKQLRGGAPTELSRIGAGRWLGDDAQIGPLDPTSLAGALGAHTTAHPSTTPRYHCVGAEVLPPNSILIFRGQPSHATCSRSWEPQLGGLASCCLHGQSSRSRASGCAA
jgi:hypothetical protein